MSNAEKMGTLSILLGIIVTARALLDSFIKMDAARFEAAFEETITRGDTFSKQDDAAYTATLSEDEATMYAAHARYFLESLAELKAVDKSSDRITRAGQLAQTVALWHSLSMFKTMSGISVED